VAMIIITSGCGQNSVIDYGCYGRSLVTLYIMAVCVQDSVFAVRVSREASVSGTALRKMACPPHCILLTGPSMMLGK
jgi:hypothetical protein